jgi:hypothetical protein
VVWQDRSGYLQGNDYYQKRDHDPGNGEEQSDEHS